MSKTMQNLVVLMEPSEDAWVTSLKGGNMTLNRFCIDEDAAFELSGVNYLKKSSREMERTWWPAGMSEYEAEGSKMKEVKGRAIHPYGLRLS